MNYPTTVYDSYGAQQLPKEREEVKDECIKNHIEQTDYFDNIIQPNDRVFELVFRIYEPNDELQSVMIYTVTEIVTQSTIAELIDKLGSENLISIEHLGLGKEIYGG